MEKISADIWIRKKYRRTEPSVILLKNMQETVQTMKFTTARKLKLLSTHTQKHYFVVSAKE